MYENLDRFMPSVSVPFINESVSERKIYYRLGESEIFQYANTNTTINGEKMIDVIPKMVIPDHGFMQIPYSQLDKAVQYEIFEGPHYKLTCKKQIRNLIETGKVVMVYSTTYKLPTSLPYIIQSSKSNSRVFVNISDFVVMDQYGKITITQSRNYNAFMSAIFAACVSYSIVAKNSVLPASVGDGIVLIYANMLERVINSLIHLDPITRDKLRYLSSKLALVQMYGTEKGLQIFYRMKNSYFPKLNKMVTESMDAQFHETAFDKLSLFIDELKNIYPSMRGLSEYAVYDKWIRLYGSSTALSLDYIGFHIYTICMVLFESPLIMRMALEPVMEKNKGTEIYQHMQVLIGQ